MIRLTDEEIYQWLLNRLGKGNRFEEFNRKFCEDWCKAQLQKVIKWGNEECTLQEHGSYCCRKYCYQCWQELVKEANNG